MKKKVRKTGRQAGFEKLDHEIIKQGLCCVCGACAGLCPTQGITMNYGTAPLYQAEIEPILSGQCQEGCEVCYQICPGKDIPLPAMDELLFGRRRNPETEPLGIYQECLGGHARSEAMRREGANGGAGTALLTYALKEGIIDGAIVAGYDPVAPWRGRPHIVTTEEELLDTGGRVWELVPQLSLLWEAVHKKGLRKLAITCSPCHAHAIRKMQLLNLPETGQIAESISFSLGVFCSIRFFFQAAKHALFELCGVEKLQDVARMRYRAGKTPKHFMVDMTNGRKAEIGYEFYYLWSIKGWPHERCMMCYDYAGEVADLAVGEFWDPSIPGGQELGWSTILTRTNRGEELVLGAEKKGFLYTKPTPEAYLVASADCECKKHAQVQRLVDRIGYEGWPTPDYGYPCELGLRPRPPKYQSWRVKPNLAGALGFGVIK